MGMVFRPSKTTTNTVAMSPSKQVTTGGPNIPSLQKGKGVNAYSKSQGVKQGKPALKTVAKSTSPNFAGKAAGKPRKVAKATAKNFAGKC